VTDRYAETDGRTIGQTENRGSKIALCMTPIKWSNIDCILECEAEFADVELWSRRRRKHLDCRFSLSHAISSPKYGPTQSITNGGVGDQWAGVEWSGCAKNDVKAKPISGSYLPESCWGRWNLPPDTACRRPAPRSWRISSSELNTQTVCVWR